MRTFKPHPAGHPRACTTVLLTIVTKLRVRVPWLSHLVTGSLHLAPCTHSLVLPVPPQTATNLFSVFMSLSLFVSYLFFKISHISEIVQYLPTECHKLPKLSIPRSELVTLSPTLACWVILMVSSYLLPYWFSCLSESKTLCLVMSTSSPIPVSNTSPGLVDLAPVLESLISFPLT